MSSTYQVVVFVNGSPSLYSTEFHSIHEAELFSKYVSSASKTIVIQKINREVTDPMIFAGDQNDTKETTYNTDGDTYSYMDKLMESIDKPYQGFILYPYKNGYKMECTPDNSIYGQKYLEKAFWNETLKCWVMSGKHIQDFIDKGAIIDNSRVV